MDDAGKWSEVREKLEKEIAEEGIDKAVNHLNRMRAQDMKALVGGAYPDMNLQRGTALEMTKKELLKCIKDYYSNR